MRVLGVDPGLSRCGVGVIESDRSGQHLLMAGVVRTRPDQPTAQRLASLHSDLTTLLSRHRPDSVAVERVFFNANVQTAMAVGQAAGVALLAAAQAGLPTAEYTPTQAKATITGTGDAPKEQVGFMVRSLLRLEDVPRPADAADALAVALCHLQRAGGRGHHSDNALAAETPSTGLPPRLAAAVESAGAGAQIVQPRREGRQS